VKIDFRTEKNLVEAYDYKSAEGAFVVEKNKRHFLLNFKIIDKHAGDELTEPRTRKIEELLHIANEVIYGYKFKNFDHLKMVDQYENVTLRVNEKDIYDFNKKRLSVREIVQAPPSYF
jgi:hypothetical protein